MTDGYIFPDTVCSERLKTGLFTEADAGFIIGLLNSKGWLDGIGNRNVHTTVEATAYIHKINHTEHFRYWAVRLKENDQAIGMISCIKRADLEDFDLGFAFLGEYSGKGYAQEAAKAVILALKKIPRFQRLLAYALPTNHRSLSLLEKLDFRFENEYETRGERLRLYVNDKAYE